MIITAIVIGMKRADSRHNHSACAGQRGLGALLPNKQSAKGATFALLAAMLRDQVCFDRQKPDARNRKFMISNPEIFCF
ncbi:MAG: hypothetical protein IKH77_03940 [Clostridia bacterium]|nr:hypothetical protein [Clostridia bacterium]